MRSLIVGALLSLLGLVAGTAVAGGSLLPRMDTTLPVPTTSPVTISVPTVSISVPTVTATIPDVTTTQIPPTLPQVTTTAPSPSTTLEVTTPTASVPTVTAGTTVVTNAATPVAPATSVSSGSPRETTSTSAPVAIAKPTVPSLPSSAHRGREPTARVTEQRIKGGFVTTRVRGQAHAGPLGTTARRATVPAANNPRRTTSQRSVVGVLGETHGENHTSIRLASFSPGHLIAERPQSPVGMLFFVLAALLLAASALPRAVLAQRWGSLTLEDRRIELAAAGCAVLVGELLVRGLS